MSASPDRADHYRLLQRQLKRFGIDPTTLDPAMSKLLQAIDDTYQQYERDYSLLEHSLELTSRELVDRNAELREDIARKEREQLELVTYRQELEEKYARQAENLKANNKRLKAEVAERERVEQSLRQSESWLLGLFRALEEAVIVFGEDNQILTLNPAAERLFQYTTEELAGKNGLVLYADPATYRTEEPETLRNLDKGVPFVERNVFKRKNDETFDAEHTVSQLRDSDGNKLGMVCVMRDLTEQIRQERIRGAVATISEAALEQNSLKQLLRIIHEQIGTLLDTRNFFVSLYDSERKIYTVPYVVDQYDEYPEDMEITGMRSVTDYVRRTGQPLLADAAHLRALEDLGEVELIGTDSEHWMGVPLRTQEGVIGVVVVQTYDPRFRYTEDQFDLMIRVGQQIGYAVERKRAEQSLRQSEQRTRAILDALPDLVFVINQKGEITDFHVQRIDQLFVPPEEFLNKPVDDVLPQSVVIELRKALDAALESGDTHIFEYQLSMNDRIRWYEGRMVQIETDEALCVVRDRTEQIDAEQERLELEAQMQHTQKLESLGVLAGGIAHDFNNLLVGIMGNANLALTRLQEDIPVQDLIERIQTASMRAADLTGQMLAYSGKGSFVTEPVDLTRVLEEMSHLLEVSTSRYVQLVHEFDTEPVIIEADRTQIGQVAMNLITNASEAIGEQPGRIVVRTGNIELTDEDTYGLAFDHEIDPGHYRFLEIEDDGSGMDRETVNKMFDPFFTTKFTGRGLGLAAVLGIVRSHHGALSVRSEPGVGTSIRIYFPPADAIIEEATQLQPADSNGDAGGMVLLVDDDETVRDVAGMMLRQSGYEVIEACDGRQAVDVYQERGEEIGLVLLDMTMPVLDGVDTFRELRLLDEDVRVLLTSGYNEQDATSKFDPGLAGFIQKPYQVEELLGAVRRAFQGRSSS